MAMADLPLVVAGLRVRDEEGDDEEEDGRFSIPARAYLPGRDFLAEEDTGDFPPPRGDTEDEACASDC